MKRSILLAALLFLVGSVLHAQILVPVKWSYGAKKVNDTAAIVFLKATIDSGWHVYSQHVKPGGPIPTSFTFDRSADYELVGKTVEPRPIVRMEKVFAMNVGYFERSVIFQQKIKLKKAQVTVGGKLGFMTCNDKECLPPDNLRFSIPVN